MQSCPQCGATVGPTQRLCRGCGCRLDQPRPAGGFWARLRRCIAGAFGRRRESPRSTVSRRSVLTVERQDPVSLPLEALSAEQRAALAAAVQGVGAADGVATTTGQGPVRVVTHTVTRTFRHPDEVPPELREQLAAAMAAGPSGQRAAFTVSVDGVPRTYARLEDVPEPYREAIRAARAAAGPS